MNKIVYPKRLINYLYFVSHLLLTKGEVRQNNVSFSYFFSVVN